MGFNIYKVQINLTGKRNATDTLQAQFCEANGLNRFFLILI